MDGDRSVFQQFPRISSLSDLVFGLALTIGAMTLIGQQATDIYQLLTFILLYGFSFIILIGVWRIYSQLMSVVTVETSGLFNANVFLLFLVTVEPFLYNTLFMNNISGMTEGISVLYALDLAGMFLVLAFFAQQILHTNAAAEENDSLRFRLRRDIYLVVAVVFLISCLPLFWSLAYIPVLGLSIRYRFILWILFSPLTVRFLFMGGEKYLQRYRYKPLIPQ